MIRSKRKLLFLYNDEPTNLPSLSKMLGHSVADYLTAQAKKDGVAKRKTAIHTQTTIWEPHKLDPLLLVLKYSIGVFELACHYDNTNCAADCSKPGCATVSTLSTPTVNVFKKQLKYVIYGQLSHRDLARQYTVARTSDNKGRALCPAPRGNLKSTSEVKSKLLFFNI